jgi:hypothetical protein
MQPDRHAPSAPEREDVRRLVRARLDGGRGRAGHVTPKAIAALAGRVHAAAVDAPNTAEVDHHNARASP